MHQSLVEYAYLAFFITIWYYLAEGNCKIFLFIQRCYSTRTKIVKTFFKNSHGTLKLCQEKSNSKWFRLKNSIHFSFHHHWKRFQRISLWISRIIRFKELFHNYKEYVLRENKNPNSGNPIFSAPALGPFKAVHCST